MEYPTFSSYHNDPVLILAAFMRSPELIQGGIRNYVKVSYGPNANHCKKIWDYPR